LPGWFFVFRVELSQTDPQHVGKIDAEGDDDKQIEQTVKTAVDEQRPFMLDYPFAYPHNHRRQRTPPHKVNSLSALAPALALSKQETTDTRHQPVNKNNPCHLC
jgi:hypothetical protein